MGFFLLIERKLIRLIQFRLGPNKIIFVGLLQFLFDIIKVNNVFYNFNLKGKDLNTILYYYY